MEKGPGTLTFVVFSRVSGRASLGDLIGMQPSLILIMGRVPKKLVMLSPLWRGGEEKKEFRGQERTLAPSVPFGPTTGHSLQGQCSEEVYLTQSESGELNPLN